MIKDAWKWFCRFVLWVGLFLLFFVMLELARAFIFFYRVNVALGIAFAVVVAGFVISFVVLFARHWFAHPKVLQAPELPEALELASHKDLVRYCRYLQAYLQRLEKNRMLSHHDHELARDGMAAIDDCLRSHPLQDDLIREIQQTEAEVVTPLLDALEKKANEEIRHSVRDVMLGVTLSPYHSVDVFVVIYRNAAMILRIARVYESRPETREQMLILRDTFRVVATVNLLNLGKTLIETLFAKVPLVGKIVDDMGQGLGAGLLTSAAGHAAIERCAAFRRWNREAAAATVAAGANQFFTDVKDLFLMDVLPSLKGRIRASEPPETVAAAGFWDSISRGVGAAVDATAKAVEVVLIKPAVVSGRGVAAAGRGVARAGSSVARATARGSRRTYRGIGRVFRTFGQRIKYTFTGRLIHRR